jgi:hypothetical protein
MSEGLDYPASRLEYSDRILLGLLAATDAVFIPDRDPLSRKRHAVLWERRKYFRQRGLPWSSEAVEGASDEAVRKRVQREIDRLKGARFVHAYRPQGSKTVGLRLTDAGDQYTRALAGLPTLASSLVLISRLRELTQSDAARPWLGRMWVPETVLTGVEWGDNEQSYKYVELEEQLLPAIVRGWVICNCSIRGHGWYSLVKPSPPTSIPAKAPEKSVAAREISALYVAKPENDREIGQIPMPVCPERSPEQQKTQLQSQGAVSDGSCG